MKTNLTKILVLTLSLALLVGVAIGITVSAEEYSYEIKSMNISHGDNTIVLVAVDAPATGVAPEGVEVTYVDANGETLTAKYYGDLNVYGTTYPIYYTKGIPAKDIGQDVIATVSLNGEAKDSENVSVAEYLYGKLYKEEYIKATDGKDLNKKNLYLNLLDYAASAETVLWNDKDANADDQRVLVTDKFYVYAEGQIEDVLASNETFTLNYTGEIPEGYAFSGYWVSTVGGTIAIKDGTAVKPTKHAVYTPVFYANEDVAGKYYTADIEGARYDFSEEIVKEVYSAENPDGDFAAALISDSTNAYKDGKATLAVTDNGALKYTMNSTVWGGYTLSNKGYNEGVKFIAEFDFTYTDYTEYTGSSSCDNEPFFIGLTKSNENNSNFITQADKAKYTADHGAVILYNVPMVMGETYNVRIVYSAGTYSAYVDGVCTYTATAGSAADSFAGLAFYVRSRHAGNSFGFELDNVYIGSVASYYDDIELEGTRYNFDDGVVPAGVTHNTKRGTEAKNVSAVEDKTVDESGAEVGTGNYRLAHTTTAWWGYAIESGDNNRYSAGKYVFEADLCVTKMAYKDTSGSLFAGLLGDANAADDLDQSRPTSSNVAAISDQYMSYASGATTYGWYGATLNIGETYKICIVYDVETGNSDFYVDGVLVSDDMNAHATKVVADTSLFYGAFFYPRASGCTFTLDNVYLGVIDGVIAE